MDESEPPLRIGVLGAARIAPMALLRPARAVAGARVVAIAARDERRARAMAERHGVPRVLPDYAGVVDDPEIDAVYVPLPNSLHCEWTIRALEAGKHVLCEKPIASNADEAVRMAEAARRTGRRLVEAFHWRHHPLAHRMLEIVASGELGTIRRIETSFCIPLPLPGDIRYRLDLSGGATMDTGCYAIHALRTLAGAEPEVISARAKLARPRVDRAMEAEVRFADGRTGRMRCALFSARLVSIRAAVFGDLGEMRVFNFVAPHVHHRLWVTTGSGTRRERLVGDATYVHQLRAFVDHVRRGTPTPTGPADALANMRVIDAVYEASGLGRRGG
ncbi:Gfo/Idh/MocA family oxidoreductase [bacterium]|nr:Gfo/Idh/MocA family oxidoreductase [bacterium]